MAYEKLFSRNTIIMPLTTLTSFTNSLEANIAKNKLQNSGIPSFLAHENFVIPFNNINTKVVCQDCKNVIK